MGEKNEKQLESMELFRRVEM